MRVGQAPTPDYGSLTKKIPAASSTYRAEHVGLGRSMGAGVRQLRAVEHDGKPVSRVPAEGRRRETKGVRVARAKGR